MLPFIMLNPSTADAEIDDPTIRRCMGFARRQGHAGIVVGNLYGLRATDPADLWRFCDPRGPNNMDALKRIGEEALAAGTIVVAAWGGGIHSRHPGLPTMPRLYCLGKTKQGYPRHPLYVRSDQPLEPWP